MDQEKGTHPIEILITTSSVCEWKQDFIPNWSWKKSSTIHQELKEKH